jgi:biopolymer transport protein ExbD
MANTLDTRRKGSVNVELNIVPFIDVMSCLTAFLLVTAVWIHVAELQTQPSAPCPPSAKCVSDPDARWLSVFVEADEVTVARHPDYDARHLAPGDWNGIAAALRMYAGNEHPYVEVAAYSTTERPVPYQSLVAALDTAVRAGLTDTRIVDPRLVER